MTGQSTNVLRPEAPMDPFNLFEDSGPPYIPSSPPREWSFDAEEEELKKRPDTPFYRMLRKAKADIRARCNREAQALGFPTFEAQRHHEQEERHKRLEKYKEEYGHSPQPPPMTEEQKIWMKRQEEEEIKYTRPFVKLYCDCFEHIHPFFCPQKLRSQRSHGDDPSHFDFLQSLHPIDLNVHIDENDPSSRVPDWFLEDWWGIPSPTRILRLPHWAKRDEIVQRMINREEVDDVMYYGDPEQKKSHPPRNRTISSSSESSVENIDQGSRELVRHEKPEENAAGLTPKQSLPSSTTDSVQAHASFPSENSMSPERNRSHSTAKPSIQAQKKDASDLRVHETMRFPPAQSARIKKRPTAKKEAAGKAALSNKIQSRAQDFLDSLTQDSSDCVFRRSW